MAIGDKTEEVKQPINKKKNGSEKSIKSQQHQNLLPAPPLPPRRSSYDVNGRRYVERPDHGSQSSASRGEDILVLERKVLAGVTAFTVLGFLLWVISVSTDYWFTVRMPAGSAYLNKTQTYFTESHSGLWRICRTEWRNHTGSNASALITLCRYHQLFPSATEMRRNPQIDRTILHYTRTETAFSIISIVLMVMGFGFSIYTFFEHRYMFKRLASGVHFLTAATVLVVVEVLINSVYYEENNLKERHPSGARWYYGFSLYFACFSFSLYMIAGCAFLVCSRKRKGEKAPSELYAMADEPHILGRV